MPVRALVAAGALFGIGENNMRVSLARLVSAQVVVRDERGSYRLGERAEPVRGRVASWRRVGERLTRWNGGWVAVQPGPARAASAAVLVFWVLAEAWSPFEPPRRAPRPLEAIGGEVGRGPVLCVPVDGNLGFHSALQTVHAQPISSGYLARPTAARYQLRNTKEVQDFLARLTDLLQQSRP